jgi:hypothetical protein
MPKIQIWFFRVNKSKQKQIFLEKAKFKKIMWRMMQEMGLTIA